MQKVVVNRVFYLNVNGITPSDIPNYIEACRAAFAHKNPILDALKAEGTWEDIFVPIREGEARVEILVVQPETGELQRTNLAQAILEQTVPAKEEK